MSDALLRDRFGDVWPVHTREFTRLLIALCEAFDGDLDALFLMSAIGERVLAARAAEARLDYADSLSAQDQILEAEAINALSLAAYTGLRRETCRRKVAKLVKKGWLARDERGYITLTQQAVRDLDGQTRATFRYLDAVHRALSETP
jgi:hypothetical protein